MSPIQKRLASTIINDDSSAEAVAKLRAMNEAGNITWDVVDVVASDAMRLCDEGLAMEIDPATHNWHPRLMEHPRLTISAICWFLTASSHRSFIRQHSVIAQIWMVTHLHPTFARFSI